MNCPGFSVGWGRRLSLESWGPRGTGGSVTLCSFPWGSRGSSWERLGAGTNTTHFPNPSHISSNTALGPWRMRNADPSEQILLLWTWECIYLFVSVTAAKQDWSPPRPLSPGSKALSCRLSAPGHKTTHRGWEKDGKNSFHLGEQQETILDLRICMIPHHWETDRNLPPKPQQIQGRVWLPPGGGQQHTAFLSWDWTRTREPLPLSQNKSYIE